MVRAWQACTSRRPHLVNGLIKHEDVVIRQAALEAAAYFGENFPSTPPVKQWRISLHSSFSGGRALGSFSADPEIWRCAKVYAIVTLGSFRRLCGARRCGGRLAVPALIDAMDHRSSAVYSAIQALGRMVPDSFHWLFPKDWRKTLRL